MATVTVTGRVTLNGRGRAGVRVSNGEIVTVTSNTGTYRLRVDPDRHRFVFVVTPDGARAAGGFHRACEGWDGDLDGVDFALVPAPERARTGAGFVHLTDTHVVAEGPGYFRNAEIRADLRRSVAPLNPAFVVVTGDLTNLGDRPGLKAYRGAMQSAGCPVFHLFGGHDGLTEFRRPEHRDGDACTRNFEAVLGPTHYSFDWGGRHYILYPNEDRFFSRAERETRARWLIADLRAHAGRESLLFVHVPPTSEFLDRLVRRGVRAVCCGHWHSSKVYTYRGITVMAAPSFPFGGIDTSPRSFRRVRPTAGRIRSELVPVDPRPRTGDARKATPRPVGRRSPLLELLWSRRLPASIHRAGPRFVPDGLLVPMMDEGIGDTPGILCLDPSTGRSRWRLRTDASPKGGLAVADGVGAAVSVTGRVCAFDTATGKVRWLADLPGYPDRWIFGSPLIDGGVVYAGGKAGVGAFDLTSGRPLWHAHPAPDRSDAWSCFARPLAVGGLLILLVQRRGIVALDRDSGREVWAREIGVEYMYPGPVEASGLILTGSPPGRVTALEPEGGRIAWTRTVTEAGHLSGLCGGDGACYVAAPTGEVAAFGLSRGRRRWRLRLGRELLDMSPYRRGASGAMGGPLVAGGRLILGAGDGHLRVLDCRDGRELDRWRFGAPISAPPDVGTGRLAVGAYDGRIACFGLD